MEENQKNFSDKELVQKSLSDTQFFGEIVNRYENKLSRYIRNKTHANTRDIEDLLQEVFIKVYTHLNGYDACLPFSSWIYRITHNHIISWHRKNKQRISDGMMEIEDEVIDSLAGSLDLEGEVLQKDEKAFIWNTIQELPNKFKDVIILRFFEYKDYDEISDILKIPKGTVATNLSRAKQKLAKTINQAYE